MKAIDIFERAKKKKGDIMRMTICLPSSLLDDIKEIKKHASFSKTIVALLESYLEELRAEKNKGNLWHSMNTEK